MFFGGSVFSMLGIPEPQWFVTLSNNKMNAFVASFFMNAMANSGLATGAFEVEVDGKLVFSKLDTGRMPSAVDIVRGLEAIGFHPQDAQGFEAAHLANSAREF
jgi:selT/selW/selH-like putative selenoprotein